MKIFDCQMIVATMTVMSRHRGKGLRWREPYASASTGSTTCKNQYQNERVRIEWSEVISYKTTSKKKAHIDHWSFATHTRRPSPLAMTYQWFPWITSSAAVFNIFLGELVAWCDYVWSEECNSKRRRNAHCHGDRDMCACEQRMHNYNCWCRARVWKVICRI